MVSLQSCRWFLAVLLALFVARTTAATDLALLTPWSWPGGASAEERAAYEWALARYDARVVSFREIREAPQLLRGFRAAWWHLERSMTLPPGALEPEAILSVWDFAVRGGGLVLTGFATQYAVALELTDTLPTEIARDPKRTDDWGFLQKVPAHPIYRGLPNPFATVSSGLLADNSICWWVDPSDFDGRWLGDVEWNAGLMTCGEINPGAGRVLAIGAGAFEWHFVPQVNQNRPVLEAFTRNVIDYAGKISEPELLAWWTFDELAGRAPRDEARRRRDLVRGLLEPEWTDGVHGFALGFDGQSTYVTSSLGADEAPSRELTIAAWVALRAYPVETAAVLNQHVVPRGFGLFVDEYGRWNLSLAAGGAWRAVFAPKPLPKFEWHPIAGTYDGSVLRLFLDGREVAQAPGGGVLSPGPEAPLEIGRHNLAGTFGGIFPTGLFNGLMDDVRLYSRALSPQEIRSMHEWAERPSPPPLGTSPELFERDPHRPRFHPTPPRAWTNEPHGPVHWNGLYHVFYQTNPAGQFLHQSHWGHMASANLVDWTHFPHALWPEADGPDALGTWSGDTIVHDGRVRAVYTSNAGGQTQSLATALDDQLLGWEKHPENPVTGAFPPDVHPGDVSGFRDPCLFRLGEWHYMAVGSGRRGAGGFLPLYRSRDLQGWEYRGRLHEGDLRWGEMWEMPQFFEIAPGTWVLFVNPIPDPRPLYWIGRLEGERFVPNAPDDPQLLDKGHRYLSPSVLQAPDGRWLAFGIVPEDRSSEEQLAAGWANLFGLPRELTLQAGFLGQSPARELEMLRREELFRREDFLVRPTTGGYLPGVTGDQLEIHVRADLLGSETFGLIVRRSPRSEEETRIGFNRVQDLFIVRARSSTSESVGRWTEAGTHPLAPGEFLDLRVFIDHSVLTVFANGRNALTTRIYPVRPDSLGADLYVFEEAALVVDIRVWRLAEAAHREWWPSGPPALPERPEPPAPQPPRFRRGDANTDRTVDLSDAVAVLGYLFLGGDPLSCLDAADTNDTGSLDISDAIAVLNYLFLGSAFLPDPGAACGEDPTADPLEACTDPGC